MPTFRDLIGSAPSFARLLRSQRDGEEARARWRTEKLASALRSAAAIPYYRRAFGGDPAPRDLAELPTLQRSQMGELHESVVSTLDDASRFPRVRTSGSSGSPVWLLFDPTHQRGRFAARARYLWENGWRPQHRSAWLIGILAGSPDGDLTRSKLLGGARFLSHVKDFEEQAAWLARFDPHHLYTMPSNLDAILRVLENETSRLPSLRTIFTTGEVLEDSVRERTRQLFGREIADGYGTTEAFLAWQCPEGSYHVNDEHVLVEIVDEKGRPTPPGDFGRVLFTTLENRVMPLVRYDIDDYAEVVSGPCPCGRTLSRLGAIQGRGMNLFRGPDGALLSPWKLVEPLRELPTVRRSQVIQHDVDRFTVRFVSDAPPPDDVRERIRTELVRLAGPTARFAFERVDDIPRTPRGKYMGAICELA